MAGGVDGGPLKFSPVRGASTPDASVPLVHRPALLFGFGFGGFAAFVGAVVCIAFAFRTELIAVPAV